MTAHNETPDLGDAPKERSGSASGSITAMVLVINALFAGIGALYVTTHSVVITVVASVGVIGLIALTLWRGKVSPPPG